MRPTADEKPKNLDLQLPSASSITPSQKLEIGHQYLEKEIHGHNRLFPSLDTTASKHFDRHSSRATDDPKSKADEPKWKPLSFVEVTSDESAVQVKQQTSDEVIRDKNEEPTMVQNESEKNNYDSTNASLKFEPVVKNEPKDDLLKADETVKSKEEKIFGDISSKNSGKKSVVFKKRIKGAPNLRERLND